MTGRTPSRFSAHCSWLTAVLLLPGLATPALGDCAAPADVDFGLSGDPLPPADPLVQRYEPGLREAIRLAHNDAFATHWGSTAQTERAWREQLESRTFRPDSSTVWIEDGDVLAYVLTYQWVDGELYVGQVGTRQRARGRGLARACLVASLHAAASSGRYASVDLSVDSENPTGAGALYESVGFAATLLLGIVPGPVLDLAGTAGGFIR